MRVLRAIFDELAGLIIDDRSLALAILAVVLVAVASASLLPTLPLLTGAILLFGCLSVLVENVSRSRTARP
ncbi:MAG: hypothetical protein ACJ8F3_00030 [Xanthobacteraceae bacterium]